MSYATQQDLIDRYGEQEVIQLTDRADPPAETIDAAVVAKALADAGAMIDGYLGGRYTLPLATVPPVLTGYAGDIARYRLYGDAAPDRVEKAYRDAIRFLEMVAAGKISLGAGAPAVAGAPEYVSPGRMFTHDTLKDL